LKAAWRKRGVTPANYATLPEKHPVLDAGTLLVAYVTGGKLFLVMISAQLLHDLPYHASPTAQFQTL